jgi:hypothetical protein
MSIVLTQNLSSRRTESRPAQTRSLHPEISIVRTPTLRPDPQPHSNDPLSVYIVRPQGCCTWVVVVATSQGTLLSVDNRSCYNVTHCKLNKNITVQGRKPLEQPFERCALPAVTYKTDHNNSLYSSARCIKVFASGSAGGNTLPPKRSIITSLCSHQHIRTMVQQTTYLHVPTS